MIPELIIEQEDFLLGTQVVFGYGAACGVNKTEYIYDMIAQMYPVPSAKMSLLLSSLLLSTDLSP